MNILIEKISINKQGILCVKPKNYCFDKIYRSATGIHWDENEMILFHNPPCKWDAFRWYKQILLAVKSEYGKILVISADTIYENLNDDLTLRIKGSG